MDSGITRRELAAGAAMAALGGTARAQASNRVRLGFIGVGNRGSQLLTAALAQPDAEIVAFCDLYRPYLDRAVARIAPPALGAGGPTTYADFRIMLERKDIDAVVIATP